MTRIDISGAKATVRNNDVLTRGMVGAMVEFRFDKRWEGLTRTAVFQQDTITRDVINVGNSVEIPPEVLQKSGFPVKIGVYGTNSDGSIVIPTIWAETDSVREGADPSGDESTRPSLPVWQQIINGIQHAFPANENELAELLDVGMPVYIGSNFELTRSIIIDKDNAVVEFGDNVVFDMTGKGFPAIQIGSEANPKPVYLNVKNPRVLGDKTAGSVGLYIYGMGFACSIVNPKIYGCEYGIRTKDFDCAQLSSIYEPYLGGGRIGLEDSGGGLQAARIYGGRIEQNSEYGIVTASPNMCFMGTVIEGNTIAEVKLLNTLGVGAIRPSGGTWDNCYFEHLKRIGVSGTIFQLGDASQDNGWLGYLGLLGCKFYNYDGDYVVTCDGNALPNGGGSAKNIVISGCNQGGKLLFRMPNVGVDCRITVTSNTTAEGASLPTEGVNTNASIQYMLNAYTQLGLARATAIEGKDGASPLQYAHTREIRLEPAGKMGQWIEVTCSDNFPWVDSNVGVNKGSMHYCTATSLWYVRMTGKGAADDSSKWHKITTTAI